MTMLIDPNTGLSLQEVVPGSADDPFTASSPDVSVASTASPAAPGLTGTPQVNAEEGKAQPPTNPEPTPASPENAQQVPAAESVPGEVATPEPEKVDVEAQVKAAVEEARRALQSDYDKRFNAIQSELQAEREKALKAEREAKLNSDDLSDEERDILRNKYALEDREQNLTAREQEVEKFFTATYIAALAQENGQYGVTAADLEGFSTPEEMDLFVKDKQLEFYRSGKHQEGAPVAQAASTPPQPSAPAGASAPSDLGGSAPAAPTQQLSSAQGTDAMAHNLKYGWENLSFPN